VDNIGRREERERMLVGKRGGQERMEENTSEKLGGKSGTNMNGKGTIIKPS